MSDNEKIERTIRPEALKKDERLLRSPGTGTDVWDMLCAAIAGDLETIQPLLNKDPSLVCCQYAYRTLLYPAGRDAFDVSRSQRRRGKARAV